MFSSSWVWQDLSQVDFFIMEKKYIIYTYSTFHKCPRCFQNVSGFNRAAVNSNFVLVLVLIQSGWVDGWLQGNCCHTVYVCVFFLSVLFGLYCCLPTKLWNTKIHWFNFKFWFNFQLVIFIFFLDGEIQCLQNYGKEITNVYMIQETFYKRVFRPT